MTDRPNGTLYTGVTNDLARRAWEHRTSVVEGFTTRYGLKRLVFAERCDDIRIAIQRERNMKHWPRALKVRLIPAQNPGRKISTSASFDPLLSKEYVAADGSPGHPRNDPPGLAVRGQ